MESGLKYGVLEKEIALIEDPDVQEWTMATLLKVPDYFWIAPTSTTGKYHPAVCNLKGGLITHTKRVVWLANKICHAWGIFAQNRDVVLAACILHDIAKVPPGTSYAEHEAHPINAQKYFAPGKSHFIQEINACIQTHMGRWSMKIVAIPIEEYTLSQLAVYTADLLASVKDLGTPRDQERKQ